MAVQAKYLFDQDFAPDAKSAEKAMAPAELAIMLAEAESNGYRDGFGAVVRVNFGGRWGPAGEVHGGGGYWSQDSPLQVLSLPEHAREIQVRWPGGSVTSNTVPDQAHEILVTFEGKLQVLK